MPCWSSPSVITVRPVGISGRSLAVVALPLGVELRRSCYSRPAAPASRPGRAWSGWRRRYHAASASLLEVKQQPAPAAALLFPHPGCASFRLPLRSRPLAVAAYQPSVRRCSSSGVRPRSPDYSPGLSGTSTLASQWWPGILGHQQAATEWAGSGRFPIHSSQAARAGAGP